MDAQSTTTETQSTQHLVAQNITPGRQSTTVKVPSTSERAEQHCGEAEYNIQVRVQQPTCARRLDAQSNIRSPRHLGAQSSATERQGTTTKEPQTLGDAELYHREAYYNKQGAPDIWGRRDLLQRGSVQQPRSPRHMGAHSSITDRQNTTIKEPQTCGVAEL